MRKRKLKRLIKVTAIALAVAALSFTAAYLFFPVLFFKKPGNNISGGVAAAGKFDTDMLNIVLLGFDRNEVRGKKKRNFPA